MSDSEPGDRRKSVITRREALRRISAGSITGAVFVVTFGAWVHSADAWCASGAHTQDGMCGTTGAGGGGYAEDGKCGCAQTNGGVYSDEPCGQLVAGSNFDVDDQCGVYDQTLSAVVPDTRTCNVLGASGHWND
ncbi:MAG: hypothetical protein KAI66_27375, partial [Lentisphaeria bacterium]|nr:hypothetical protein [Lentisphaeria bacterium]